MLFPPNTPIYNMFLISFINGYIFPFQTHSAANSWPLLIISSQWWLPPPPSTYITTMTLQCPHSKLPSLVDRIFDMFLVFFAWILVTSPTSRAAPPPSKLTCSANFSSHYLNLKSGSKSGHKSFCFCAVLFACVEWFHCWDVYVFWIFLKLTTNKLHGLFQTYVSYSHFIIYLCT